MSRIPTVFFLSVYGLVAMAGLMLAFAEGNPFPEILTPALALVAYVLTDRTRRVYLPLLWANMLGVTVFLAAGWQMRNQTLEQRLLVAAHLLVYLSWIVLFQKKNLAQYWWMCALAVLQVAVGSILTIETSYGGLLVAFMFMSIWTLSLMSLYEAYLQYEAGGPSDVAVRTSGAARSSGGWRTGRKAAAERARTAVDTSQRLRGAVFNLTRTNVGWDFATRARFSPSEWPHWSSPQPSSSSFRGYGPVGRSGAVPTPKSSRRSPSRGLAMKCGWATWCRFWKTPSALCRSGC